MVSKEADSVVGPYLSQRANKAGVVATPVDGDQPSLLIGLLSWARLLGLNVVAAGKSSEYDFVYDRIHGTVSWRGEAIALPDFADVWVMRERGKRPLKPAARCCGRFRSKPYLICVKWGSSVITAIFYPIARRSMHRMHVRWEFQKS